MKERLSWLQCVLSYALFFKVFVKYLKWPGILQLLHRLNEEFAVYMVVGKFGINCTVPNLSTFELKSMLKLTLKSVPVFNHSVGKSSTIPN